MQFGSISTADAQGAILAHSVMTDTGRLRKGQILTEEHVSQLLAAGVLELIVARLEADDVQEDEAARRVADALVPDPAAVGLRIGNAGTGRVNIFAEAPGILDVDVEKINALNAVDPMITVATVPNWQRTTVGMMCATVKIIAYGVSGSSLAEACGIGKAALRLRETVFQTASLVQTRIAKDDGARGHEALAERLLRLGVELMPKVVTEHDTTVLAEALSSASGDALFVLTGSATSDPNDVAPSAVRAAGGSVSHFGMPVDPGNLLFLGELKGKPVIGLPGCARSPALNGADWVLERVLCGVEVKPSDIMEMGVGGLLKEIPQRGRLREKT